MSNKGKTFTHADLPKMTQLRLKNGQVQQAEKDRLDAWLASQTERYKIVAMHGEVPIIAEELDERLIREHATISNEEGIESIDTAVLVQLRNLMQLTPEQRVYVLESFEMDGNLVNGFDPPPEPVVEAKPKKAKK